MLEIRQARIFSGSLYRFLSDALTLVLAVKTVLEITLCPSGALTGNVERQT